MSEMIRAATATILFGLFHSALASLAAKRGAARLIGERTERGLYRLFYIFQSFVTIGVLMVYLLRLPVRTIYHVRGRGAVLLRLGQLAAGVHAVYAAHTVGIPYIAGLRNLQAWLRGETLPPGPIAQGPEKTLDGQLTSGGPFQWSRHPLNLSPVPIFWLFPHMTTRLLGFNLAATLYLVLGSWHEEERLSSVYGEVYERYRHGQVPFYLPHPPSSDD